eukprot:SAG25_NODE_7199_length_497_cov_1.276382_1_plen_48_part_10
MVWTMCRLAVGAGGRACRGEGQPSGTLIYPCAHIPMLLHIDCSLKFPL